MIEIFNFHSKCVERKQTDGVDLLVEGSRNSFWFAKKPVISQQTNKISFIEFDTQDPQHK